MAGAPRDVQRRGHTGGRPDIAAGPRLCGWTPKGETPHFSGVSVGCDLIAGFSVRTADFLSCELDLVVVHIPHEHPVVLPHVSHFMHVPFRTSVKLPHSLHISPS